MEQKIQEEAPENVETTKPETQETKNEEASSPSSPSSSDSSKSSQDERERKENDGEKRQSRSKSPRRTSKSKSRSKERRSASRSESHDNSENERKERGKKYRGDEKSDSRPQNYRGGYQKYREGYNGGSRSRSRSPADRRYPRHGDKKQTFISKPTLDGPLWTFRQFMESQRTDVDPSKAEKVYEKYKKEYEEKQNKIFFAEHKGDEWFKEKYDVINSEKFKEERKIEDKANAERFLAALRDGGFEGLNLNYEEYEHKNLMSENIPRSNNEPIEEEKEAGKAFNNFTEIGLEANLDITGAPFFGFDPNSQTLFIKSIPKFISRWDLTEALKKLNGYLSLSLSEPLKSQEFIRFGWILFDSEDNCNKAYEFLKTLNIKNFAFNIVKSRSQRKSVKICENMDKERINTDLDLSRQLIYALDDEKDIKNNALLKNAPQNEPSKQLDLQILYLRKVHSYCFYCAAEYVDERMLAAKCGPIHLRRFKLENQEPLPDLPDWHKRISEIVKARIEESGKKPKRNIEDIEKYAEDLFDVELRNKCEKISIKHGNWPCKYCHKIFKADHFVVKHIKTKHGEKFDKIREKKMYENYSNDKNKITATFSSSYSSHRGYGRHQGGRGGYRRYDNQNRGGYQGQRQHRPYEYKDLDDPQVATTRTSRPVIDYGDL